ncbi:CaiB/BaiF CoA transferase family protein [Sphingomonas jatrophae]|uniref:Crotonobetainyl-CoA:carnitine CoA-transferase CaiB n=1 Tax=Sphingomonas jatrophae TaxID=1166337 RepID=A0A1I6KDE1_9SPHN|nr:CaiB/BaiF CoA-transferase family protein [Sphingomonas jatrophae]SFR89217.1 Crotonobetainyl-CoA:carnitine CoA-transferase CaiB [Sphingomonas jatrophae]
MAGALDGIKVLDLSRVLAGPWCTQILADFGADVLKIEAPGAGDDTRSWGPPYLTGDDDMPGEKGESAYYLSCNRNKRSVAVNLADQRGADLIRRLAAEADILVENFKLGGLAKYGLDYAGLKAINPRLVYTSITGFGQTGPYASRAGYDFVAQAMGGLMSITGEADGSPMKVGVAITDLSTGMYAATSTLMALRHAERTGEGQHVDVSLLDTQISMLANQALTYLVGGQSPGRLGNAHPTVVPYRLFRTANGEIVIAVGNNGQFRQLVKVLGVPELADDPRYATNGDRVHNRAGLEAQIEDLTSAWASGELTATLLAAGVPAGPVNEVGQILTDEFAEARGTVHHFTRADGASVPSVAYPGKLSATPATFRRIPPRVGEHSRAALAEWLGLADEELDALAAAGVIADRADLLAAQKQGETA